MTQGKRITIAEVAEKAGVSKQTVSRVINERPDVAPATREKIQSIMRALGYSPDPIARSMRGVTDTLAILAPNLCTEGVARMVHATQVEARKLGYYVYLHTSSSQIDSSSLLHEINNRRISGLIIIQLFKDWGIEFFELSHGLKIPIICINCAPSNIFVPSIYLDDFSAGLMATNHLLSLGHTSIATVLGPENDDRSVERYNGFIKAFELRGLPENRHLVLQGDWSPESGKVAIKRLQSYSYQFSAIFAHNDYMALGAIDGLRETNLKVPNDISVVGCDDLAISAYFNPPLTTVRLPYDELGQKGVQVLVENIKSHNSVQRSIKMDPTLIVRESCKPFLPKAFS